MIGTLAVIITIADEGIVIHVLVLTLINEDEVSLVILYINL